MTFTEAEKALRALAERYGAESYQVEVGRKTQARDCKYFDQGETRTKVNMTMWFARESYPCFTAGGRTYRGAITKIEAVVLRAVKEEGDSPRIPNLKEATNED